MCSEDGRQELPQSGPYALPYAPQPSAATVRACKIQLGSTVSQPPNVGVVQVLSHNADAARARSPTNFEAGTTPTGIQFRVPISLHRNVINDVPDAIRVLHERIISPTAIPQTTRDF